MSSSVVRRVTLLDKSSEAIIKWDICLNTGLSISCCRRPSSEKAVVLSLKQATAWEKFFWKLVLA